MTPHHPVGAFAMQPEVLPAAFPGELLARLGTRLDLLGGGTEVLALDDPRLAHVTVLFTSWGCQPIDATVLDAAPRLRAVIHAAGSVRGHLTEEVWHRGIAVSSAADANADPVADFTAAAISFGVKRAFPLARRYAEGHYPQLHERPGADGRVVGVVGASRIGRRVIRRLVATGYQVLVADPYLSAADAAELGARVLSLDEVCRRSDVLTVHAPQLPSTRHLVNAARLALLPDGALVVNTARGSLIDTGALLAECATGRLDAILDVTDPEPLPAGHPLFALPNVLITPHVAGVQGTEVRRFGAYATAEAERFVAGEPLLGEVLLADLPRLA
ncbi:hydroxyacid dehydrogenase [Longispora albida]|uniref:hydroxyacid dehydrogenase n=1 Tax=Longispora albida TaxID=203523 RepID=UPI00036A1D53|nr:hydroxyacid dehydrogenase [Longispora albida]